MATVIDALIVELGLDPRGFDRGQREAVQQLRRFERDVDRASQRAPRGLQRMFDMFRGGGRDIQRFADQHHRAAQQAEHGFRVWTTGFNTMTTAALAAFTALRAVQGVINGIVQSTARSAQTGFGAGWAGVGVNQFSAIANAAFGATGASREGTQGLLQRLARERAGLHSGAVRDLSELQKQLGMIGINWDQDPTRIMEQLADWASRRPAAEVQARAQQMGLDPLLAEMLMRSGGAAGFRRQVQQAEATATTTGQAKAAQELAGAWRDVNVTIEHFWEMLLEHDPRLTQFLRTLDGWLKTAQQSPEAMRALATAVDVVAIAFGVTLAAAVGKATAAMLAFGATPVVKALTGAGVLGRVLAGGAAAVGGLAAAGVAAAAIKGGPRAEEAKRGAWSWLTDTVRGLVMDPVDLARRNTYEEWVESRGGPRARSPASEYEAWERANRGAVDQWNRDNPRVRPGAPAAPAPGGTPGVQGGVVPRGGPNLTIEQMRQYAVMAGFRGRAADMMAAIAMAESRGNPYAHNPIFPDDSYGITQINALAHGAKARGAYGNPQRAMELAWEVSKGGTNFMPWSVYKSGAYRQYLRTGSDAVAATPAGGPVPEGTDQQREAYWAYNRANPGRTLSWAEWIARQAAGHVAAVQLSAGGAAAASSTTNHNTYGGTQTGDINVNVPAGSDGLAIGGAIQSRLREMRASNANTGLM